MISFNLRAKHVLAHKSHKDQKDNALLDALLEDNSQIQKKDVIMRDVMCFVKEIQYHINPMYSETQFEYDYKRALSFDDPETIIRPYFLTQITKQDD